MTPTAAQLRAILLTGVLMIISAMQLQAADSSATLWQKANEFYKQKQYGSALGCFEKIAAIQPGVAEVYYNIGNTYYKLNKIGPAVLNYERALHINPDYKEAQENLLLTQNRISNRVQTAQDIFFINWWQRLTKASLANMWAIAGLITFIIIVLIMAVNRFKAGFNIPGQLTGILTFVWVCILVLAFVSAGRATGSDMAVVMQNDAPLMNDNLKGKPQSLIPEGTTVKIKSIKAGYIEITLPDGRTGWLQQDQLVRI